MPQSKNTQGKLYLHVTKRELAALEDFLGSLPERPDFSLHLISDSMDQELQRVFRQYLDQIPQIHKDIPAQQEQKAFFFFSHETLIPQPWLDSLKESSPLVLLYPPQETSPGDLVLQLEEHALEYHLVEGDGAMDLLEDRGFMKGKGQGPSTEELEFLLNELCLLMEEESRQDFRLYKGKPLFRRIQRRMEALGIRDAREYAELMHGDKNELRQLHKELLIGVTAFFRDGEIFNQIEGEWLIPWIKQQQSPLRVWVPACSTGQEAYSWALMLEYHCLQENMEREIQIFASDVNGQALEKARDGYYPKDMANQVPSHLLEFGFIERNKGYQVKKSIREKVIFAEHNLMQDPPYSRLDLISCRNLLIYLKKELQEQVLSLFHYALNPGGMLLLGNSENLGNSAYLYETEIKICKLYRKLENKNQRGRFWSFNGGYDLKPSGRGIHGSHAFQLNEITEEILLRDFSPPAVLINPKGEILYIQGKTGRFLEFPTGTATHNLLKTAREGLKIALANGVRKTKQSGVTTFIPHLKVSNDQGGEWVDIKVMPVLKGGNDTGLILVVFQSGKESESRGKNASCADEQNKAILDLEKELSATQEYLQSTIEELETTNDELKSSNEEAQSTNEELQSANEELQTSREELQAVNEELTTTNQALQRKIEELTQANNDISNLLSSTQIATVFLDKEMKIFRFTPSISTIIDLVDGDIGRNFTLFAHKLNYQNLMKDAQAVLETLIPREAEVVTKNGSYYWMRILPYRTQQDSIEGLVLTFTDINEKRKQEEEILNYKDHLEKLVTERTEQLNESEQKYRALYENAPQAYQSLDSQGNIIDVNPSWEKTLGYKRGEVLGKWFGSLLHPTSMEDFRRGYPVFLQRGFMHDQEFLIKRKSREYIHCSFEGSVGYSPDHKPLRTYCSFVNISERKAYEQELLIKDTALENSLNGFHIVDSQGRIIYANPAFIQMWGYQSPNQVLGIHPKKLFIHEEKYTQFEETLAREGKCDLTFQAKRRDGSAFHVRMMTVLSTEDQERELILGTSLDISQQMAFEESLKESESKYRLLVENQTDLIIKTDRWGHLLFTSQSFCRTVGKSEQELLGQSIRPFVHPEDYKMARRAVALLTEPPYISTHEQRSKTRRGWRWFSWVTKAELDAQGQIQTVLAIGRDISERKKAEEALMKSEERYRTISSLSTDHSYCICMNPKGQIVPEWSFGGFEKLTGYDPKSIWENGQVNQLFFPEDLPIMEKRMEKLFSGQIQDTETRIRSRSGEIHWIRDRAIPQWDEEGKKVARIIGMAQNITQQKLYEKELQKSNEELNQTLNELKETQDKLVHQERLAAMGQFSAGIAHDFNNILTGVLGTAEILRLDDKLSSSQMDHVETILQAGERAAQLVRQIMDYSRKTIRSVQDLNLEETIRDSIRILRSGITEKYKLELTTKHFDGSSIKADKTQIEQIIVNLVMNSRDAMKQGGTIQIELKNRHFREPGINCNICNTPIFGEYIEITVSDQGCGISREDQKSIFEPFFTTKGIGRGSGLGLSQIYGIVVQYQGHIMIQSQVSKGTSISILLPPGRNEDIL